MTSLDRIVAMFAILHVPLKFCPAHLALPMLGHSGPVTGVIECRRQDGAICEHDEERGRPVAVHWPIDWFDTEEDGCYLVHELAHVVVGSCPMTTDEINGPLLAVEDALQQAIGLNEEAINDWMSNYSLGDQHKVAEWGLASASLQQRLMGRSRHLAREAGLLTHRGEIVSR